MRISKSAPKNTITFKTSDVNNLTKAAYKWWKADSKREMMNQVLTTAAYLKETQSFLFRQTAIFARLYGNHALFSFIGTNTAKLDSTTGLPADRPTFNLVQSCIDTVVSKLSQNKPSPVFLTDDGDYKERRLSKQLNNFILGEFYQTKAYEKGTIALRDACVLGDGIIKIFETQDKKVGLDRVLKTELLVDPNDGMFGDPRQLFQCKLVDRSVLAENFPNYRSTVAEAATAYPDNSSDSAKTVADQVLVVEAWHLPSGKDANDGRHVIVCSAGIILDEKWTKPKFPFIFLHFSPRLAGFWAQGMSEQLMGTQIEINSLLFTISKAIKLVGVPRVFIEAGSKVTSASFNNDIGTLIKFTGVKPQYEVAPCVPQELYAQLERLIQYGYQQCGVSTLQASAQKPAGLNSGEAIRSYDDISTDRLATLDKRYTDMYIELAYAITDLAKDIAERDGKYQTIYPGKDGTKKIDLPEMSLIQDPFIIQCFSQSSLPKDPAGRMQTVTEWIQAGMVSIREGMRLLDFPDLGQINKLMNASEERIFQAMDAIIEEGKYTPPDSFMDLDLATKIVVQYYNLYSRCKIEDEKKEMLQTFFLQVQAIKQQAATVMPGAAGPQVNPPQAQAAPLPQSPLVSNAVGAQPGV